MSDSVTTSTEGPTVTSLAMDINGNTVVNINDAQLCTLDNSLLTLYHQ